MFDEIAELEFLGHVQCVDDEESIATHLVATFGINLERIADLLDYSEYLQRSFLAANRQLLLNELLLG